MKKVLERPDHAKTREWMFSWEERALRRGRRQGRATGLEQGREQGRELGLLAGQKRSLKTILRKRFPDVPNVVLDRIEEIDSPDRLESLQSDALDADAWETLGL